MKRTKIIFSLAAVLLAVVGSVATNASGKVSLVVKEVSLPMDPACNPAGFCNTESSTNDCSVQSGGIYKVRVVGSSVTCSTNAQGIWQQDDN